MSRSKFAVAKELIQEKHYSEARALLKTIDDQNAKNWLKKLDKIAPEQKRTKFPLQAVVFSILFFCLGLGSMYLFMRFLNPSMPNPSITVTLATNSPTGNEQAQDVVETTFEPTRTPTQESAIAILPPTVAMQTTATAISDSDATQIANITITLSVNLTTYCESVAQRSKGDCARWADTVLDQKLLETAFCYDEYDWITDTNNYSLCLLTQGISALGEQAIIPPLDGNAISDSELELMGALIAYCDDNSPEDYCYIWSVHTFMNQGAIANQCYNERSSVTQFFACLSQNGIQP